MREERSSPPLLPTPPSPLLGTLAAAGMLRQSSAGGNKRSLGIARLSNSHFFPLPTGTTTISSSSSSGTTSGTWGCTAKSSSLSSVSSGSDSVDAAPTDSDYIMQLVNDVRHFADVLLQLKEAFNSKGKQPWKVMKEVELCGNTGAPSSPWEQSVHKKINGS